MINEVHHTGGKPLCYLILWAIHSFFHGRTFISNTCLKSQVLQMSIIRNIMHLRQKYLYKNPIYQDMQFCVTIIEEGGVRHSKKGDL